MESFDFRSPSKICSIAERNLRPGEEFYSILVEQENGDVIRREIAAENWTAAPENCFAWWKTTMPSNESGKVYWAPRAVMLAFFDHVRQQPGQADTAYLTALLLAQKKILATKESWDTEDSSKLVLENRKEKIVYEIPVVDVSPQRQSEIQKELAEKLFSDFPPDQDQGEV